MLLAWLALIAFVVAAIAIDLRAGSAAKPSIRSALVWSIVWTGVGIAFTVLVAIGEGGTAAGEYLAGFLIEKSLSLDNLFVFAVLFTYFAVPDAQRRRVLLIGIAGAIVLRTVFILVGAAALDTFSWFTYVLGAILAITAVRIALHSGDYVDPENTLAMRTLRRLVPLTSRYDGDRLLTRENGRRVATPLLAALTMVAAFDVLFAVDSIPAIFAITRDTFLVFAANAFSLLGMVSLYFLLDGLLDRFRYLNVGLAAILGFVAARLLLEDVWHPPIELSLLVIVASLATAALASVIAERRDEARAVPDHG